MDAKYMNIKLVNNAVTLKIAQDACKKLKRLNDYEIKDYQVKLTAMIKAMTNREYSEYQKRIA